MNNFKIFILVAGSDFNKDSLKLKYCHVVLI